MARLLTLRDVITKASMEIGTAQRPVSAVIGSLDQDIIQMQALLHAVADEVLLDEPYRNELGDGMWILDENGNPKEDFTADSDLIAFDGRLAVDGVKYRFLKAKGLEFGEEMRDFINRLNKLSARINGVVLDLDLDEGRWI